MLCAIAMWVGEGVSAVPGKRWGVLADGEAGVVVWFVVWFVGGSVFTVEYGVLFLENASLVDQH